MGPLKDLLLFSRIIKKKFRPNFSLFTHFVTNIAFLTEAFHYLKMQSNGYIFYFIFLGLRKSVIYKSNYWAGISNITEYFDQKTKICRDNLVTIKVN